MEDELMEIDRAILVAIRSSKEPLSTYGIAKGANISWSTANSHCYKLKSLGLISARKQQSRFGQSKILWQLKKK
ncbi:MAG: hypothetical protein JW724_07220 [Candidatus Altiarchaeota archaeon]|nr:hypothetical protein [Candidatus Altiarchaeota archaeon]